MARFTIAGSPDDYLTYLARDYEAEAWNNGLVAWVADTLTAETFDDVQICDARLDASSAQYYVCLMFEAATCDGTLNEFELRIFLPFWAIDLARFYRQHPRPRDGWARAESVKHLATYARRRDGKAS